MEIYTHRPDSWQDLQNSTLKYLEEIGYSCELEKDLTTVRGNINIDVYAENIKNKPHTIIICECKQWNKSVSQDVVYSFRSILSDIGANYGFIISKLGFQKGAFDTAKNTNILLFTWNDFQDYFRINWIKSMTLKISKINKDLQTYIGAGFPVLFKTEYNNLSNQKLIDFNKLWNYYFHTAFYSMNHEYKDLEGNEFDISYFEHHIKEAEKLYERTFVSYEDFFNFLILDAKEGIEKFDKLFGKKIRKK